jgi:histidinol-phosphate aminotransferase
VYGAARRPPADDFALLASNENPFDPLPSVLEVVRESSHRLNRYPEMTSVGVREALAERLAVSPDRVVVGAGSVGVLQQLLLAFAGVGEGVVFPWRSFEAYPILIGSVGATGVAVPLASNDDHDLDAMAAAIGDRTRMVLLCLPNNPTGTLPSAHAIREFIDRVPDDVLVVIDEAYVEFVGVEQRIDSIDVLRDHANVCVIRTFSKAYGLAGLRIGYAIASADVAGALRRVYLPFAVSALAQRAACASLAAESELQLRVDAVVRERARVTAAARAAGWRVPDSHANFIWLRSEDDVRRVLMDSLDEAGVLARAYPSDGVRVSIGTEHDNDRVVTALRRAAEHLP